MDSDDLKLQAHDNLVVLTRQELSDLVCVYADQYATMVRHAEHFLLPLTVLMAYGYLDNVDVYRIADCYIPLDEVEMVLAAIAEIQVDEMA
ncbi:MAG: hypothetical protein A2W25_15470 [candidate division Zixibacteria bacterium RBG_16_53_22]|nr:MAG: hypothetical protein A2W25_15470 [candidate division Zixibacteria bacterium RBG_16_53_22]